MAMSRRKAISLVLGLIISAVALWAVFRGIDISQLWSALKTANYWLLVPNIVLVVLVMFQRALRWKYMLIPVKEVPFDRLMAATCIGFMANNVLPLRLGEFVRAYSLAHQDKDIPKTTSLATIFVERMVFDLAALLLIFAFVLAVAPFNMTPELRTAAYTALAVAMVGFVAVLIIARKPERIGEILAKYLFFLPDRLKDVVKTMIVKFSDGLSFLKHLKASGQVSLHTMLIWLVLGLSNYTVFLAFGFDVPLSASFVLLVIVSIAILIPASPGFIGVYHYAAVFTLQQYGIPQADALSFALVLHAAQYVPVTLMGFFYLKKAHLSLKELEEKAVDKPLQTD